MPRDSAIPSGWRSVTTEHSSARHRSIFGIATTCFGNRRVTADWDGDGQNDKPDAPAVASAYRAGHAAEWQHIRKIHPGLSLMGNTDGDLSQPEYKGQLQGAFLEGLMGVKWSLETWAGWEAAMKRYRAAMTNTCAPHWVGFNVHGKPADYRFFRYAYASCLLDDGYFCYTDTANGYSSVAWFDEFDFKLGSATTKPPLVPWKNGVWRRDFANGIALVNPAKEPVTITLEPGFSRLRGQQDRDVNNGRARHQADVESQGWNHPAENNKMNP